MSDDNKKPVYKPQDKPSTQEKGSSQHDGSLSGFDGIEWIGESQSDQEGLNKAFELTPRPNKPKKDE